MKDYIWPVISLILAASIQGNLPPSMSILGAKPDLILVVLITYSLERDPVFGSLLGFIAGMIHGTMVGVSIGGFIATRTITGFLGGMVTNRLFGENPIVPVISAALLTLVCEIIFLFGNPGHSILANIRIVIGECIYNALFTLILCKLLGYFNISRKIRLANARL